MSCHLPQPTCWRSSVINSVTGYEHSLVERQLIHVTQFMNCRMIWDNWGWWCVTDCVQTANTAWSVGERRARSNWVYWTTYTAEINNDSILSLYTVHARLTNPQQSSTTLYRVRQKKLSPVVFFKFLSNRSEFFHETLLLYSLLMLTYKCQILFNYLEIWQSCVISNATTPPCSFDVVKNIKQTRTHNKLYK